MAKRHTLGRAIRRLDRSLGSRISDTHAIALVELAADPAGDPATTISTARRLEARGGREHALRLLRAAVANHPTDADLHYQLGFLLERDGQFDTALEAYTTSIELGPTAHNLYRRGKCHQALVDHAAAAADFAYSLRFNAADFRVHQALLKSSMSEPLWRRLEILEAAISATEVDHDWRALLASARHGMGHYEDAAALYERLDLETPQDTYGFRHVECLYLAGHHTQARQQFRIRSQTLKNRGRARAGLGAYLQSLGRWSDAAREYEHALGSSPTPEARHQCGYAYLRTYQYAVALPLLSQATRSPGAPASWAFHEGMCLEKMDRLSDAIESYLWAYGLAGSPYHLYRAVACAKALNNDEYCRLVEEHLRARIVGSQPSDEEPIELTRAARQQMDQARKRGARATLRAIAYKARREGRPEDAEKLLTWLCDSEDSLHQEDHVELAAALLQLNRTIPAFEAYLGSRPFTTAHGQDESNLPSTLDRQHAIYIDFCENLPVDPNKVLYESNHGTSLTCNVLPLLQHNLRTNRGRSQYHVVVLNDLSRAPEWLNDYDNVVCVRRDGHAYRRHLATAGWLINNNTFSPYFSRRPEQQYLNTWHGTPLKTLGRDIRSGLMDHKNAARNFLHATHLALPNRHTARVLVDRYDVSGLYPGKLALTGSPRVDSTVALAAEREGAIRATLPNRPIVLYAPTWRGTLGEKEFDTQRLIDDLNALGSLPIHLIFKPHPLTEELLSDLDLPAHRPPAGVDTNELLAVTDVLITDYSSIFFDYYPLNRPVLLYAYDEDEYFEARGGAYYDIDQLPGTACRTIGQVMDALTATLPQGSSLAPGEIDVGEFCSLEDGSASHRVLSFFFEGDQECVIDSRFSKSERSEILFFAGSFIPNGITNSFSALTKTLLNGSTYNLSVILQPEAVYGDPRRLEKFQQFPQEMRAFGRVGSMAATAEEQWLIDRFNAIHDFFSSQHLELVLTAFRREFRRLFGYAKFDHVVCFEGYARFWAILFASAVGPDTSTHIYLHSDMDHERDVRFRYLDGVFTLYKTYDSLISVSDSVNEVNRDKLARRWGLEPRRMVSARNMIDQESIRERAEQGPTISVPWDDSAVKTFVSTGRLTREKGHDLLLEAFAQVASVRDDVALMIVGDGPLKIQLESFVSVHGLRDRVSLPGYMENPLGVVATADCFVFPSRYEGQGLSLVEGLALGLPGIGTDVVGVRSVLADGEGLLVEFSAEGIERGLLTFLDGGEIASRPFDSERYVARALAEFEAALEVQREE